MRIIVWLDSPYQWERDKAYRAGTLVRWAGDDWVCLADMLRAQFPPPTSTLWAKVRRR